MTSARLLLEVFPYAAIAAALRFGPRGLQDDALKTVGVKDADRRAILVRVTEHATQCGQIARSTALNVTTVGLQTLNQFADQDVGKRSWNVAGWVALGYIVLVAISVTLMFRFFNWWRMVPVGVLDGTVARPIPILGLKVSLRTTLDLAMGSTAIVPALCRLIVATVLQ